MYFPIFMQSAPFTESFTIIGFNMNSIPEHFEEFTSLNLDSLHHSTDCIR